MSGPQADSIARDLISAAGYGEAFGHSLGHGVGLAIHEGPRLAQSSTDELPIGAVVSVEPGIYVPDWGGVRVEDVVVVQADRVEVLTRSSKEPLIEV